MLKLGYVDISSSSVQRLSRCVSASLSKCNLVTQELRAMAPANKSRDLDLLRGLRKLFIVSALAFASTAKADTVDHYMNIVNNLPQMEMKADSESQAWARSARNILMLTSETVAESLILVNQEAEKKGAPIFCLPPGEKLSNSEINELIKNTYVGLSGTLQNKNQMTVSQIALIGMQKKYPCNKK